MGYITLIPPHISTAAASLSCLLVRPEICQESTDTTHFLWTNAIWPSNTPPENFQSLYSHTLQGMNIVQCFRFN